MATNCSTLTTVSSPRNSAASGGIPIDKKDDRSQNVLTAASAVVVAFSTPRSPGKMLGRTKREQLKCTFSLCAHAPDKNAMGHTWSRPFSQKISTPPLSEQHSPSQLPQKTMHAVTPCSQLQTCNSQNPPPTTNPNRQKAKRPVNQN